MTDQRLIYFIIRVLICAQIWKWRWNTYQKLSRKLEDGTWMVNLMKVLTSMKECICYKIILQWIFSSNGVFKREAEENICQLSRFKKRFLKISYLISLDLDTFPSLKTNLKCRSIQMCIVCGRTCKMGCNLCFDQNLSPY